MPTINAPGSTPLSPFSLNSTVTHTTDLWATSNAHDNHHLHQPHHAHPVAALPSTLTSPCSISSTTLALGPSGAGTNGGAEGSPRPDAEIMEFISKIGQIIVRARTAASNGGQNNQHQTLDSLLQDTDVWKGNPHVYINIHHTRDQLLLERWVISYSPPVMTSMAAASRSHAVGHSSPTVASMRPSDQVAAAAAVLNQTSPALGASVSGSASPLPNAVYPSKDTTDLVLLLQSLYSRMRALPLQNSLSSFEDTTRLSKADLSFSISTAHDDTTEMAQHVLVYGHPNTVTEANRMDMDIERDPATTTTTTTANPCPGFGKQAPTVEFVGTASLKVVNFEASHNRWGSIRVTGMYDESVGGRVQPEDFQEEKSLKKKKSHRGKTGSRIEFTAEMKSRLLRQQQQQHQQSRQQPKQQTLEQTVTGWSGTEVATLQPRHAHGQTQTLTTPAPEGVSNGHDFRWNGSTPHSVDISSPGHSQSRPLAPSIYPQRPSSPIPTADEVERARLVTSFRLGVESHGFASRDGASHPVASTFQSLAFNDEQSSSATTQPSMSTCQFPPLPSPPMSIPGSGDKDPGLSFDVGVTANSRNTPSQLYDTHLYHQPQMTGSTPSSLSLTTPFTLRRTSRLSIVMSCDDNASDHSSPHTPQTPASKTPNPNLDLNHSMSDDDEGQYSTAVSQSTIARPPSVPSPTRASYLRRNSLCLSANGGDLFGSLVGSYEESILSGRMSTLPSKPLMFTAQIGALASSDYKDCPERLRCPRHVQLEFPAVFYDYDTSGSHHHQHHSHSSQPASLTGSHGQHPASFSKSNAISPSSASLLGHSYGTTPPMFSSKHRTGYGSSPSSHHEPHPFQLHHQPNLYSGQNVALDPILPYVGNVDLENGFRGARRFARMPGGMRLPLRGQVQVMIKNPNKTVVKVFLVPYDFTDMPPNTKTFLRQKSYSTGPGMGPHPNSNPGGTLRYAIHLQFCCPAPGYVYLYRSIRVVFANRVPDGKDSLRVVVDKLGNAPRAEAQTLVSDDATVTPGGQSTASGSSLEDRYVPMRKGEVMFSARKRKREAATNLEYLAPVLPLYHHQPPRQQSQHGRTNFGLGLDLPRMSGNNELYHGLEAYQFGQQRSRSVSATGPEDPNLQPEDEEVDEDDDEDSMDSGSHDGSNAGMFSSMLAGGGAIGGGGGYPWMRSSPRPGVQASTFGLPNTTPGSGAQTMHSDSDSLFVGRLNGKGYSSPTMTRSQPQTTMVSPQLQQSSRTLTQSLSPSLTVGPLDRLRQQHGQPSPSGMSTSPSLTYAKTIIDESIGWDRATEIAQQQLRIKSLSKELQHLGVMPHNLTSSFSPPLMSTTSTIATTTATATMVSSSAANTDVAFPTTKAGILAMSKIHASGSGTTLPNVAASLVSWSRQSSPTLSPTLMSPRPRMGSDVRI